MQMLTRAGLPGRRSTSASQLRWRSRLPVSNGELFVALLVDVAMLTGQLYLAGGAANPFVFLYLLQVIAGRGAARGAGRPGPSSPSPAPASPALALFAPAAARCRSTTTRGLASPLHRWAC